MLRARLFHPGSYHGIVLFRAMATQLKDYVSHYDVLEVSPECTKTEIREAWLRLSMLYHPDLNKDNEEATKKFMEVKESYKMLVNDVKRKAYNDKIGFYHSDPPPEFQREWTYEGEMERSGAQAYQVLWSEESIRKLMCSEKLRDLNWSKQPPAERYRILEEEQKKQNKERAELTATGTLSLKVGADRYFLIIAVVGALFFILKAYDRQIRTVSLDDQLLAARDYVTQDGGLVTRSAQIDITAAHHRSVFDDPAQPNRYWIIPGRMEGLAVADNSHNAPNPNPLDDK
eukprot:GFUD01008347.1.p1 GENE.GFUD01008347.1~~GFUD01008347.1.p1  ORF type:complete len:287 (-),score=63.61 GFUD01008347.1:24-884(-)